MKPIIGITARHDLESDTLIVNTGYYRAILKSGGIPFMIPVTEDETDNKAIISNIDGVILTGGNDVDPKYFNESPIKEMGEISPDRDIQEIYLAKVALSQNIPILGICRGMQVLNIAAQGDIYQDIYSQILNINLIKHFQDAPKWYATHEIIIEENTKLFEIINEKNIRVNSFHHQSVKSVCEEFTIVARSEDGIIEAIENKYNDFAIGIQWHPEVMWERDNTQLKIFNNLVYSALKFKKLAKIRSV